MTVFIHAAYLQVAGTLQKKVQHYFYSMHPVVYLLYNIHLSLSLHNNF
jgi:hypothetical protein